MQCFTLFVERFYLCQFCLSGGSLRELLTRFLDSETKMGINPESLAFLENLTDWTGKSVLEIGDQCIVPPTEFHMARDWYLSKGVARYVAIDLNGERGALCRDVRGDLSDLGQFDVVTNFGTLEHVDSGIQGQIEAFTSMHKSCKVGGMIIQHVPLEELCRGHSPILYTPRFLPQLYTDNDYQIVGDTFLVIGGNHTVAVRKMSEHEFRFTEFAIREIRHYEGEGICGKFVTN